ncbi:MAG: flavoprotein [Verrucomicrobiaceae bacterium]|nr:flavoprotein [Verrucomicrobiaceae bacterium]
MLNILAISGSTRKKSSNYHLIQAIATAHAATATVELLEGLDELPHFNPDLDGDNPPPKIIALRARLRAADAILICTPEYAIGVPGTLKNALDWTVSSMEFSHKPVALITAATSGVIAHRSLLGTLLIIEAQMTAATQVVVSMVKTKMDAQGNITDAATMAALNALMHGLDELAKGAVPESRLLTPPAFDGS